MSDPDLPFPPAEPDDEDALSRLIHDARTPLTGIIGFSELLLEDMSLSDQTREYLQIINRDGQRLAAMLDKYSAEAREKSEPGDPR